MFTSMDEYQAQARRIHEILYRIASKESLRIGFPTRSLIDDAYEVLQTYGFRKPLLAPKKKWTRSAIILEPKVYEFLWPHVELEFIVDGRIRFFSGIGQPRRKNPALAYLYATLPIYWSIDLGNRFDEFSEAFGCGPG